MTEQTMSHKSLKSILYIAGVILLMQSCKKDNGSSPHVVNVTTLAGDTISGFVNATGIAARFNGPAGVATDASGNVYVADGNNHCIRKITATGVVSILAGSGVAGFADSIGTAAKFNYPIDIATDASGNVYVADFINNRIRKITAGGVVSTLAGSGAAGFVNATGIVAQFNRPFGVATDASGNIYVADGNNHSIRKITAAGVVSTLAGSGTAGFVNATGTAARFNYPTGVATDASGNVYVGDQYNHRIRKITAVGEVSTLAGSGVADFSDLSGIAAQFNRPTGVATDTSGNVYVADEGNHRIRKITPAGVVSTLAGNGTPGFANGTDNLAKFNYPYGIALDASGNVYVGDYENNCIRKIN